MDQTFVLLQSNAFIYKYLLTLDWLSENNIKTLDSPAKTPDLNSIENLWGIMVIQVYGNGNLFDSTAYRTATILET